MKTIFKYNPYSYRSTHFSSYRVNNGPFTKRTNSKQTTIINGVYRGYSRYGFYKLKGRHYESLYGDY